ncbi:MAG: hypothetical protein ACXWWD_03775 [Chitinophagaceae bacterium]
MKKWHTHFYWHQRSWSTCTGRKSICNHECFKSMNADVTGKIYNNMGHTISKDKIELADKLVFNS